MARAHNIYLVSDGEGPLASFTVKHECQSWLSTYGHPGMRVRRMPDGPRRYPESVEAGRGVDVTQQFAPFLTRRRMNTPTWNLPTMTTSSPPNGTGITINATSFYIPPLSPMNSTEWARLHLQQPIPDED